MDWQKTFGVSPAKPDDDEGFSVGARFGQWMLESIGEQFADRSPEYRQAIIDGIRDTI